MVVPVLIDFGGVNPLFSSIALLNHRKKWRNTRKLDDETVDGWGYVAIHSIWRCNFWIKYCVCCLWPNSPTTILKIESTLWVFGRDFASIQCFDGNHFDLFEFLLYLSTRSNEIQQIHSVNKHLVDYAVLKFGFCSLQTKNVKSCKLNRDGVGHRTWWVYQFTQLSAATAAAAAVSETSLGEPLTSTIAVHFPVCKQRLDRITI